MQHDYILTVHVSGDPETNTWTVGRVSAELTDNTPTPPPDTGPEDFVTPQPLMAPVAEVSPVPDPDAEPVPE